MQGHYFSRPVMEHAFTEMLAAGLSSGERRFTASDTAIPLS